MDTNKSVNESYDCNEPTPADTVVTLGKNAPQGAGQYIIRMGESPIKVNGGTKV